MFSFAKFFFLEYSGNMIDKNDCVHLCLREESKKTKGPKLDRQNLLRLPMSEGGEQENKGPK
jgi:hypothetical protein